MSTSEIEPIEGGLDAAGLRIGCVVARFNNFISDRLLEGALDAIKRHGGDLKNVTVVRVPGSLELATAATVLATSNSTKFDAIICLGAVIRGETDHYQHVAGGAASSIAEIGPKTGVPTIFGVLTCDKLDQAINRAGAKNGNAGFHAAVAAIEMANLTGKLRKQFGRS